MDRVKKIIRPVSKEFRKNKCGFNHTEPDDFVKSQWQNCTKSSIYLVYRWLIALFFVAVVIQSMVDHVMDAYYFIYFTNWGILMCMFTNLLGAFLVTVWHFHPEYADQVTNSDSMPRSFKVYWVMHITTLIASLIITIVYWTILYSSEIPLTATNVLTHVFNAVFMFIDLLIVAYPIRLLHIFLPVFFGIIYIVFSVIYYECGGLDPFGRHYIYAVLDWSQPNRALTTVIGILILCCFIYVFIFAIYKLRVFIYRRFFGTKIFLPTMRTIPSIITHSPSRISMVLGNYGHDNRAFSGSSEKISN